MKVKANMYSPNFGTVSKWAIKFAIENDTDTDIERLVESQMNNQKYNVVDAIDNKMSPCFGVDLNGKIIERSTSLSAACAYATAAEKAANENGAF